MKESFVIYKAFYEPISELSDEDLGQLFRCIFLYQIKEIEPANTSRIYMAFQFFKNQFRLDNEKYLVVVNRNKNNGLKGGRPKTQDNPKNPVGYLKPKKADNDNDNDNDNDKLLGKPKPRKISFEESNLFDKISFKETFPDWSQDKLRHYYDAALRYSVEGNKYVSWELAIKQWERKDKINNVLVEKPTQKVIIW
jgi:hypothetical protein